MPYFIVNWTERHQMLIKAPTLDEAIEAALASDVDTYGSTDFDKNNCYQCNEKGDPV